MADKVAIAVAATANEREAILLAAKTENRSLSNFIMTRLLEILKEKYDIVPEEEID